MFTDFLFPRHIPATILVSFTFYNKVIKRHLEPVTHTSQFSSTFISE